MYLAWRSSGFHGKLVQVSTGAWLRARMATPFQERSPNQTASYPRVRRAFTGKAPCSVLSSWRLTTSGSALANQDKRLSSRLLMLLMLKVAILTKSLSVLYFWVHPPKRATECVVPAGIILPVERNGNPRTKTHSLVLEVASLLNGWSVMLLSIRLRIMSGQLAIAMAFARLQKQRVPECRRHISH